MRRFLLLTVLLALAAPAVFAVPTLQLYIDGATYDDVTETWITSANSFDLYVVGMGDLNNVTLSMALMGVGEYEDPSASSVTIDGAGFPTTSWTYGFAPLSNEPTVWDGGNEDLQKHDIYPAWYTEFGLGNFTGEGGIGDTNVDSANASGDTFWLPTEGYVNSNHFGWFQKYEVNVFGGAAIHFDAFTLDGEGRVDQFAPFSHDSQGGGSEIPEPATMLLFGMGLAGTGLVKRFRKK